MIEAIQIDKLRSDLRTLEMRFELRFELLVTAVKCLTNAAEEVSERVAKLEERIHGDE